MMPAPSLPATRTRISRSTAAIALSSHLDALAELSAWVQEVAAVNQLSARSAFRLELILSEAVTNIAQHAYAPDAAGEITVQIAGEPGYVIVQVEDDGRPFDPTALPAPRQPTSLDEATVFGLGVHLMRAYTTQWEYRRIGQKNQLRMTIACDG